MLTRTENPGHQKLCTTVVESHDPFSPGFDSKHRLREINVFR